MSVERERKHQKHRESIMRKYKSICHLCEEPFADAIDHVVPVALGGSDHPDNLRPAHTTCNSRKGARHYPPWAETNANMWIPSHLPEKIRAEEKAKQLRKEKEDARKAAFRKENQAALGRQLEAIRKLREQVESQRRKLRILRNDEPRVPLSKFPRYFLLTLSILLSLLPFLFLADVVENFDRNRDTLNPAVIFLLSISGVVFSIFTWKFWLRTVEKIVIRIRPKIIHEQLSTFESRHHHWQNLLAQEQVKLIELEDAYTKEDLKFKRAHDF